MMNMPLTLVVRTQIKAGDVSCDERRGEIRYESPSFSEREQLERNQTKSCDAGMPRMRKRSERSFRMGESLDLIRRSDPHDPLLERVVFP